MLIEYTNVELNVINFVTVKEILLMQHKQPKAISLQSLTFTKIFVLVNIKTSETVEMNPG